MTAPFVNPDGSYANAFEIGKNPNGTIAVPVFPTRFDQIWNFNDEKWVTPLPKLQNRALTTLNTNFTQCHVECRGYYDCDEERETWDQQKREAEAYTENSQAVTPFMDAFVAANPSMTKAQLAATIIANATAMSEAAGDLGGQLSAKRAAILAATNETELNAVDLTFVMPTINLEDK